MLAIDPLENLLVTRLGDAEVLRRTGHVSEADMLESFVEQVKTVCEPYMTFLSEIDASLWSGKSVSWLKRRFSEWERLGHARSPDGKRRRRMYRKCILPRRANLGTVAADAAVQALRDARRSTT